MSHLSGTAFVVDNSNQTSPLVRVTDDPPIIQTATITLTDAQIKALPTTPVVILPAPGANKIIMTFGLSAIFNGVGNYAGISSDCILIFGYDGPQTYSAYTMEEDVVGASVSSLLAASGKSILMGYPIQVVPQEGFQDAGGFTYNGSPYPDTEINNRGFTILSINEAGNFTGGNAANTLKVTAFYTLVDVS